MGYCVTVEITDVRIPADNVADCLAAINAMHDPAIMAEKAGGGSSDGTKRYLCVQNPLKNGFKSLANAFAAWRYNVYSDDLTGSIVLEMFEGEKWGDDGQLFQTIAPFVKDGGLIKCLGEDGAQWRYAFNDGEMVKQTAKIVWA